MTDLFYVEKVWLGQWRYRFPNTGKGGHIPPGFAVFSCGMPLVYLDINRRLVLEVYDLKGAAERQADYLNRKGFTEPVYQARERGAFPHIERIGQ